MKKILLLSLTVLSLVACKKSVNSGAEPNADGTLITLSSNVPSSRAANQGVREGLFQTGDLIGVIAAYSDAVTTPGTEAPVWTWTADADSKKLYFDNKPALFTAAKDESGTASTTISVFGWGIDGLGGLTANQYYPSKNAAIFLYAYYPYNDPSDTDTDPLYTTPTGDGTTKPSLKVTLTDGQIKGVEADDVNLKQSDILWYAGTASAKASAPTPELSFKHALAQLQFLVKRGESSAECELTQIVFKTVKEGTLDLTTGAFTYETSAADYETTAVYTITPKEGVDASVPVSTDAAKSLNVLTANGGTPLMVLPLDLETAKKGFLEVTCNYSNTAGATSAKTFTVPLTGLGKGIEQGKLNTYSISVSMTEISLEASITPWDINGEISELEAE